MGTVYLIHFDKPYKHARHYLGFTLLTVDERFKQHVSGTGARLTQVVGDAGINMQIVRTWENVDRKFERSLKKKNGSGRLCPVCRGHKMSGTPDKTKP